MKRAVLLLLWFFLAPVAAQEAPLTLEQRVAAIAQSAGTTLHYRESRQSSLLAKTVDYTGRLVFDPQTGELSKWVDAPRQARMTITDTDLELQAGGGKVRRMPLASRPDMVVLLEGFRSLLGGDAARLTGLFSAEYLQGSEEAWVLHLQPRNEAALEHLVLLEVRGRGDVMQSIDTVMADGSRQRMDILAPPATPDED